LCVVSTIISCISSRKGLCMDNNKMQPTNPNAVTQNTFEKQIISTVYIFPLLPYQCTADCWMRKAGECKVWSAESKK
jgi:hypothetical protein